MLLIDRYSRYLTLLILSLISIATISAREYAVKDVPNVHVADRTRFLSNPDGVISPQAQMMADSIMADVWNKTTAEVAAVAVESIGNADANQFATQLFEQWKIGKKDRDNGVLVLYVNDTHDIVIRTGYGVEGPLPDITAGRIIRDYMIPAFRQNGLDAGLLSGLTMVHDVLTDPEVADELKSSIPNDAGARRNSTSDESLGGLFKDLITFGFMLAIVMLIVVFVVNTATKNDSPDKRYAKLESLTMWTLITTVLGIGIPVVAWLYAKKLKTGSRNTPPACGTCGAKMVRADSATSMNLLSPQQATEQRIGSMSHDVWVCPVDGQSTVRSFPGPTYRNFTKCNNCGARAMHLKRSYTTREPSQFHAGQGMREYVCEHCGNITRTPYSIAKLVPPVVIGGFGGGGRGFGGGGFSGGSFGGGMTGGGGASGRW